MSVLALDTASALTSVALVSDGEVVRSREHLDPRGHVEALGPLLASVREVVDPSALTAIACGVGPGPYTGLRVGIAAALALGAVWRLPVVGVCSLDAVASAVRRRDAGPLGVALDARRREVYWAAYDATGVRVDGPRVGPASGIDAGLRSGRWVGPGAVANADELGDVIQLDGTASYPHAADVALLAETSLRAGARPSGYARGLDAHGTDSGATADALRGHVLLPPRPLYLRRPDVTVAGGAA